MCMKKETALKAIAWVSAAGVLFSGYMSYAEIFGGVCNTYACSKLAGVPVCMYGLLMYLALLVIAACGLKAKK